MARGDRIGWMPLFSFSIFPWGWGWALVDLVFLGVREGGGVGWIGLDCVGGGLCRWGDLGYLCLVISHSISSAEVRYVGHY
jgi:hypothetical protein